MRTPTVSEMANALLRFIRLLKEIREDNDEMEHYRVFELESSIITLHNILHSPSQAHAWNLFVACGGTALL